MRVGRFLRSGGWFDSMLQPPAVWTGPHEKCNAFWSVKKLAELADRPALCTCCGEGRAADDITYAIVQVTRS